MRHTRNSHATTNWSWLRSALPLLIGTSIAAGALSCDNTRTLPPKSETVLVVQTDVQVPKFLDTVSLIVTVNGEIVHSNQYAVGPDGVKLPGTLGLLAGDQKGQVILVRVIGWKNGKAKVVREARTTIPDQERVAMLRLPLDWLCWDNVVESTDANGIPTAVSACNANDSNTTCVAGACRPMDDSIEGLPDYSPKEVFGGMDGPDQGGMCFDTVECFSHGWSMPVNTANGSCKFAKPQGTDKFSVGIFRAPNTAGICGKDACIVPLNANSPNGWQLDPKDNTVTLPAAVCDLINKDPNTLGVAVTTACEQKTEQVPTCGPWSTANGKPGNFSAGGPDAGADASDAGPDVSDAGPDVSDAGPDVSDAGPDVSDAGPQCDGGCDECHVCQDGGCVKVDDGTACSDDGLACTSDICTDGTCTHDLLKDGTACTDDNDVCTDDVCKAGECLHTNNRTGCLAGQECGTSQQGCECGPCGAGVQGCSDMNTKCGTAGTTTTCVGNFYCTTTCPTALQTSCPNSGEVCVPGGTCVGSPPGWQVFENPICEFAGGDGGTSVLDGSSVLISASFSGVPLDGGPGDIQGGTADAGPDADAGADASPSDGGTPAQVTHATGAFGYSHGPDGALPWYMSLTICSSDLGDMYLDIYLPDNPADMSKPLPKTIPFTSNCGEGSTGDAGTNASACAYVSYKTGHSMYGSPWELAPGWTGSGTVHDIVRDADGRIYGNFEVTGLTQMQVPGATVDLSGQLRRVQLRTWN